MRAHHLFHGMGYTEDHGEIYDWIPLIMAGRKPDEHLAATRIDIGTDVNFGALTRALFLHLIQRKGIKLRLANEVRDIERADDGRWKVRSEEHTSELQSLMRISYAVFCLKKTTTHKIPTTRPTI